MATAADTWGLMSDHLSPRDDHYKRRIQPLSRQSRSVVVATIVFSLTALNILSSYELISAQVLSNQATKQVGICGCSPSNFTITLDFSLFCPPVQVGRGDGISEISCIISPLGAPTSNLEPIRLLNVDFLELDQNNNVLTQERIDGGFVDGDTIVYTSILGRSVDLTVADIPSAFQMNLNGVNAEGVALINVFVITFTNECGILPVLDPGESAGWAVFVSTMSED